MSVPDEGYSGNGSCALISISMFLFRFFLIKSCIIAPSPALLAHARFIGAVHRIGGKFVSRFFIIGLYGVK